MRRISLLAVIAVGAAHVALADSASEPRNLDLWKAELRAYHDGEYTRQIATVAARAQVWLEQRAREARPDEKLAMVFDLDETLLSNWPYISAMDFGVTDASADAYTLQGHLPAIEPVLDLVRAARKLGVRVYLLSGRRERFRPATESNLRAIGCADYTALICKPDSDQEMVQSFKTAERRRLTAAGLVIVGNIGDQETDLAGGYSERTFKLPNPFYLVP
jgi:predicted secreted acid phosphatase